MSILTTYPVCNECGSRTVLFDAYVQWNIATQQYDVVNVFEKPIICESETCEGSETSVTWKELPENPPVEQLQEEVRAILELGMQSSEVKDIKPAIEEMRKIERNTKRPERERTTARLLRELVEGHLRGREP